MAKVRQTQIVVTPDRNRVVRYKVDAVGNDLTAVLRWCDTHSEPVWVYDDGSAECPHTRIVGHDTGDHDLIDGPWEA